MSRQFFFFGLTFCLVFQPQHTKAGDGLIETATTKVLITMACSVSSSPPICYNVLNAVASNPYLDATDLTIVAIQASSKTAIATFDFINMSLTISSQINADQAVRDSLKLCAKEYRNVLQLLDKSATALTQKVDEPNVPEYLNSAIGAVAKCDASAIKITNKAVQVTAKNVDLTLLIKNALSIYQVFAEFIVNPSHDPSKSLTPATNGGAGESKNSAPNFGGIKVNSNSKTYQNGL